MKSPSYYLFPAGDRRYPDEGEFYTFKGGKIHQWPEESEKCGWKFTGKPKDYEIYIPIEVTWKPEQQS